MAGVGQLITEVGPVKLNAGQTLTTSTEAMLVISPCRPAELHTFANFEAYLSYLVCLCGKGTRSKLPQTACQRYWSYAFHSTCAAKLLSAPQHRHVSLAEDTEWRHLVAGISGNSTELLQCSCPPLLVTRGRPVRSDQRHGTPMLTLQQVVNVVCHVMRRKRGGKIRMRLDFCKPPGLRTGSLPRAISNVFMGHQRSKDKSDTPHSRG